MNDKKTLPLFDRDLAGQAQRDALRKLSPRAQWRNPVMFVVYLGSILTSILFVQALQLDIALRQFMLQGLLASFVMLLPLA